MKLETQYMILGASGTFMVMFYTGITYAVGPQDYLLALFNGNPPPLHPIKIFSVLGWSLLGALGIGFLGYQIGSIMANPKGNSPPGKAKNSDPSRRKAAEEKLLREIESASGRGGASSSE